MTSAVIKFLAIPVSVPDGGSTSFLLGLAVIALGIVVRLRQQRKG